MVDLNKSCYYRRSKSWLRDIGAGPSKRPYRRLFHRSLLQFDPIRPQVPHGGDGMYGVQEVIIPESLTSLLPEVFYSSG